MDQDKIANLIKKIRKENKLTQKQFADKYNVTYQAVSKWENGINLPDMSLLKKMSEDFNISMDSMLEGEYKPVEKKTNKKFIITIILLIIFILGLIAFIVINSNTDYEFKTLSTQCEDFNVTGSIVYTKNRSTRATIYVSDISYCGEYNKEYNNFKCTLYEKDKELIKEIDSYKYTEKNKISLEEFLKKITFEIDNYNTLCDKIKEDTFNLKIEAHNDDDAIDSYKIPLTLNNTCNN